MTAPVLAVRGLTVGLERGARRWPVVGDVSLDVPAGAIVGLVGESGSGKTTLCRAVAGLLHEGMRVEAGSIEVGGVETTALPPHAVHRLRPRGLAMVFQDPLAALNPVMRIGDQIAEALQAHRRRPRREARQTTVALLERMGLAQAQRRLAAYPSELSGGQRQRVMLAMAMAGDPILLLADEPTSALDVSTQAEILRLLRELATDRGVSILLVSHDYAVVSELCDDVCVMYAGRVVEAGRTADTLGGAGHPYTAGLIASLPSLDRRLDRLPVIPGRAPGPRDALEGCPFLPRCPHGLPPVCRAAPMTLEPLPGAPSHRSACVRATDRTVEAAST